MMEEYLYRSVTVVVSNLFKKLDENNIDVQMEKSMLNEKELAIYTKIFEEYKNDLIKTRDNAIAKYGFSDDFDYIFASIIQNVVTKKQESSIN